MSTTLSLPAFTPRQAKAAREWCIDCASNQIDLEYAENEATDAECVRFVLGSYAGGWAQFCLEMEPLTAPAPEPRCSWLDAMQNAKAALLADGAPQSQQGRDALASLECAIAQTEGER